MVCGVAISSTAVELINGLPANLPIAEMQANPLRHIHDVRVDRAGRRDVVDITVRDQADLAVEPGMRGGDIA